jgi:hypothetical protein
LKYGWGVDYVAAAICMTKGAYMVKDKSIKAHNSCSKYYGRVAAPMEEMEIFLDLFVKFKGEQIRPLLNKIKNKVQTKIEMKIEDFYA